MEMPQKPELESRQRIGDFGEIVEELTPASEIAWADYLRRKRLAEIAMRREDDSIRQQRNGVEE